MPSLTPAANPNPNPNPNPRTAVFDSYTSWWTSDQSRHNYYYWWASALKRSFDKTGNTTLLKSLIPEYKVQFLQYVAVVLFQCRFGL
jgi:hypothetical protein